MSIKKSLQSSILLIAIVPVIVMAILSYVVAITRYAQINEENTKLTAKDYSQAFASKLEAQVIETSALSNTNDVKSYLLEKINSPDILLKTSSAYYNSIENTFSQISDNFDNHVNYYLYDIDGYLVISSTDISTSDWSEVMVEPITDYTQTTVIPKSNFTADTLDIICPVEVKGEIIGLIRTNVTADYFGNYISKDAENSYFVIDDSHEPLLGFEIDSTDEIQLFSHIDEVKKTNQDADNELNGVYSKERGYIFGYSNVEDYNWIYIVKQDTSSYTKIVSTLPVLLLILLAIVTILSISVSQSLAIRYTQPIVELCDKMQAATEGQLDVQCESNWFGEFEILANNFNVMMNIISANYKEISSARKQLEVNQEELQKNYDNIERIAYTDALTGLYNRMAFYKYANETLNSTKIGKKKHAIIFIDLDGFKSVNDTLGHDYGDLLLQAVASRLSSFVSSKDILARNGGDEFVILKNDYKNTDELSEFLQTLVSIADHPFVLDDETVRITLSAGAALFPQNGITLTELMKNADIAMYTSKNSGKNNYTYFNATMEDEINRRNDLIDILKDAIANHYVYLLYQPQASVETGKITGYEALLRLKSPIAGYISPDEFIPVAEECGLIEELSEWALFEACRFNQLLTDSGFEPLRICIKVSSNQLQGSYLPQIMKKIQEGTAISLQYLEIELSEQILMENFEQNVHLIKELKDMGIRIAVDDFGTGYSSFQYITKMPIDVLKINRNYIHDICTNEKDAYIAQTIINLAHHFGISVIAEGVDTLEQLKLLQSHTCDVLQGYFYSQAVSEKEFMEMLKTNS